MRAINGLLPTSGGRIERHAKLGYVPQSRQIEWDYPMSLEQLVATSFIPQRSWFSRLGKQNGKLFIKLLTLLGWLSIPSVHLPNFLAGKNNASLLLAP